MRFPLFRLLLFVFLSSFLRAEEFGPITITPIPLARELNTPTTHGYIEYRFRVTNKDENRSHRVAISLPAQTYTHNSGLNRTSAEVEVSSNQSVVLSLLQPPLPINSGGHETTKIQIDGRTQSEGVSCTLMTQHCMPWPGRSNAQAIALAGVRVSPEIRDLINKGTGSGAAASSSASPYSYAPGGPPEITVLESEAPVGEWSENWLAYTRFDMIALTSAEIRELAEQHPEIFKAIRRYVECGGLLYIIGTEWKPPASWPRLGETNDYHAVLGRVSLTEAATPKLRARLDGIRQQVFKRADSWLVAMNSGHVGGASSVGSAGILGGDDQLLRSLPVLENFGVPIKTIMVLILLFALLIGPVNIGVLSLMKRRIWLLWTVPLTSLLASLLVYGADYIREGFLRQTASHTVSFLDQRSQEVVTVGYVGYYSTFTPGRGLTFDATTEATHAFDRSDNSLKRLFEIRMAGGGAQNLSRGWIQARIPAYFALRKAEATRKERLDFNWEHPDGPHVTNAIGVDVERLIVYDAEGKRFAAFHLAAGKRTPLIPDGEEKNPGAAFYSHIDVMYNNKAGIAAHAFPGTGILPPGMYAAEIKNANPFLERAMDRANDYEHEMILYGTY